MWLVLLMFTLATVRPWVSWPPLWWNITFAADTFGSSPAHRTCVPRATATAARSTWWMKLQSRRTVPASRRSKRAHFQKSKNTLLTNCAPESLPEHSRHVCFISFFHKIFCIPLLVIYKKMNVLNVLPNLGAWFVNSFSNFWKQGIENGFTKFCLRWGAERLTIHSHNTSLTRGLGAHIRGHLLPWTLHRNLVSLLL